MTSGGKAGKAGKGLKTAPEKGAAKKAASGKAAVKKTAKAAGANAAKAPAPVAASSGHAVRYAAGKERIVVAQSELAEYLGVTPTQVLNLYKRGVLKREPGTSDYELKGAVKAYVANLKACHRTKDETELEVLRWRAANLRQKNRDWRLDYGRAVAGAVVAGLAGVMERLRARLSDIPAAGAAIDDLAGELARANIDAAALEAEGIAPDETAGLEEE